ncbi:ABC transporter substrate-binding protein [Paraburkholderia sp. BCC1886]|uniref:ABC transporter substrate-binding protein n=1 Tax=Paraburkholderia sp. BCC1886 TaxID=2562670 RepID=UPI001C913B5C|nr:ABC transporter substrate-binding protein [Paraburkholderia sp. BCC1886]
MTWTFSLPLRQSLPLRLGRLCATLALACVPMAAHAQTPQSPHPPQASPPQRIADAWYAHNAVLGMLGAADKVVATVARPSALPWMFRIAPGLSHAQSIDGATMNAEELLRLHTDVVFTTSADPSAAALTRSGLNVVPVGFDDFTSMLRCIDLTAATLATPLARQRAQSYRQFLHQTITDTAASFADLPAAKRPRVLHIASLSPLKVDGANTIVDQWIRAAGGRNAADRLNGNLKPVSIEQVLAWQPDIVILAANAGTLDASPQHALWDTLDAVREHRVYRNPAGVFPWDRYGPEVALEVRWAAHVLHPDVVRGDDEVVMTQRFYKTYFAYTLSAADAKRILQGRPPA